MDQWPNWEREVGRKRREGNKVQEDKCPYQGGAQPNPTSTHFGGGFIQNLNSMGFHPLVH